MTGAGRGIGAAIARTLAGAGAAVVVASRTASEVEATAAAIVGAGGRAWAVTGDVTKEADVRRLGEEARARLGAVDVLVANAGDASSSTIAATTLDEWNRLLAVNATSVFLSTREFAPAMAERGRGRVVVIASIAGLEGAKYVAAYAAAKHAAVGFVRSAAAEYGARGVTVNAVCPGYADTPMTERTVANVASRTGLDPLAALAAVLAAGGQSRLVSPSDVASAVLRLCLDESADVNGQTVVVPEELAANAGRRP